MKEAYKLEETENSTIGWQIGKLSNFVDLIHGYQFRTYDFTDEGLPVIKIGNVNGSSLQLKDLSYISAERLKEFNQYKINDGDILMSLTGNIGRVIEVRNLPFEVLQNYRVGRFEPIDSSTVLKRYIKYLLSSDIVLNQIFKYSNQSAQANFGKQDMDKVWVSIPSISEQRKITDILSTVDDKIEVIGEQIEQAQELKKGLMQRLLTKGISHTKFKDSPLGQIPESWEVVNFDTVVNNITKKYSGIDGHCIELEHVEQETGRLLGYDTFAGKASTKNQFLKGDVLFCKLRPYLRKFWKATFDGASSTELLIFRPTVKLDNSFLFYLVQQESFILNSVSKSFGTKMPRTSWKIVGEFTFPMPPRVEQEKIADILTTIDNKLEVLEDKKAQYQELKKGLMQQLLTGKLRVNHLIEQTELA